MPDEVKDEKRVKISVVEETTNTSENAPSESSTVPSTKEPPKPTEETVADKPDKMPFWVMFLAFLLGLALGAGLIGGLFYFRSRVDINEQGPIAEETKATPTTNSTEEESVSEASSSATEKEEADLSQYKIQILNGSGLKGEAGVVEGLLNKAGFTDTTTGNAGTYDFQKTEIAVKKEFDSEITAMIVKALNTYATEEKILASSTFDVVITVGSKKN